MRHAPPLTGNDDPRLHREIVKVIKTWALRTGVKNPVGVVGEVRLTVLCQGEDELEAREAHFNLSGRWDWVFPT